MVKVKKNTEPQPSIIICQFQFSMQRQCAGESIAEYVAVLRKAAEHCNFGDPLSKMLHSQLVCRIMDMTVQNAFGRKKPHIS